MMTETGGKAKCSRSNSLRDEVRSRDDAWVESTIDADVSSLRATHCAAVSC